LCDIGISFGIEKKQADILQEIEPALHRAVGVAAVRADRLALSRRQQEFLITITLINPNN